MRQWKKVLAGMLSASLMAPVSILAQSQLEVSPNKQVYFCASAQTVTEPQSEITPTGEPHSEVLPTEEPQPEITPTAAPSPDEGQTPEPENPGNPSDEDPSNPGSSDEDPSDPGPSDKDPSDPGSSDEDSSDQEASGGGSLNGEGSEQDSSDQEASDQEISDQEISDRDSSDENSANNDSPDNDSSKGDSLEAEPSEEDSLESEEEETGTNEELIARQQIVIPPHIELDFRMQKVDKVYAFAKEACEILEKKEDSSRTVGTLEKEDVCYILKDDEDGWLFVESGKARGFIRKDALITDDEAEELRKEKKENAKETGAKAFQTAHATLDPLENESLLYTKTTVRKTVVEKTYGICTGDRVNIREGKGTDVRIVGQLSKGALCYVLACEDEDWIYIESGDVRGFISHQYLAVGEEAEETVGPILERGEDPEMVLGLANEWIAPEENKVCYYTFTSVKEADPSSLIRSALLEYAAQFLGNPYVWGGTDPVNGTDCSGFAQHVYAQFGYFLPRTSAAQSQVGMQIPVSEAAPGDLLFYAKGGQVYHVAIYAGDDRTLEAAGYGVGIIYGKVDHANAVWATRLITDSAGQ